MQTAINDQLQTSATILSDATSTLESRCKELSVAIEAVKQQHIQGIKDAVDLVSIHKETLRQLVKDHPDLFKKPKTQIQSNIKYGYKLKKGKTTIDDPEHTVAMLKDLFPQKTDQHQYIETKETPKKNNLNKLTAPQQKTVGITIEDDTNEVTISSTLGEAEKLINAILKENEDLLSDQETEAA